MKILLAEQQREVARRIKEGEVRSVSQAQRQMADVGKAQALLPIAT